MKTVYSMVLALVVLAGCELGDRAGGSGGGDSNATGITITAAATDSNNAPVSGTIWNAAAPSPVTLQLQAVVTPTGATGTVQWKCDIDSSVATVSNTGLVRVTGVGTGTNGGDGFHEFTVTATINGHHVEFTVNTNGIG